MTDPARTDYVLTLEAALRQALAALEHVRESPATRLSPLARQDLERGIRCAREALGAG